jgi:hypothetical protein
MEDKAKKEREEDLERLKLEMGLPPVGGAIGGKRKRVEARVVTRYDKKKEQLKKE